MSEVPKYSVLVVDEQASSGEMARRMLDGLCRVLYAPSPTAAMECLSRETVHLLIADQRLNGMSGPGFLEQVWKTFPRTIRILSSTLQDYETAKDSIVLGHVRRFFPKPWDAQAMRTVVGQELEYLDTVARLEDTVSRLRHRENELLKALEEVRSVERMKDNLQANVSHELKTPLVAGMGYVELTLKGVLGSISEEQRRGLSISFQNLAHLAGLIEDLMLFSRLRFGGEGLEPEPQDLSDCVEKVLRELIWEKPQEQVRVNVRIPADLPLVLADGSKLERLFDSLLSNAEKFSGEVVDVTISAECRDDKVVVRVSDRGPGIPEEHRGFIFDRFRMGDESSTRKHPGLGIGLALAREVARAHGSDLLLEDTGPQGSTFRFELPLVPTARERTQAPVAPAVLVIDDHKPTLDLVRHILESRGYRVSPHLSGEAGWKAFAAGEFALVLCDITLRDISGLEVIRRIVALGRGIPVYTMTARTEPDVATEAVRAGAVGSIPKPFRIDELIRGVSEALHGNGDREPARG